jgi:two-component system, OmpR family, sensor histidine kinase KdpD
MVRATLYVLLPIQLGGVIFGGVGAGLYGILMFAILAVFIASLMVGRTPEYLGKKIESFEMKMAMLAFLILALRQRMRHGNVYPPDRAERALDQFFREGNLIALREMALRKMAHVCEVELEVYMQRQGIDAAWSAGERGTACVDDQPQTQNLVRRGWRMANRYHTELLAVFVETPRWAAASPEQKRALEENLRFAEDLGAEPVRVQGSDVAQALMKVARERNVGSIIIGHSRHGRLHELLHGSIVQKLLRLAGDVDVHVVADRETTRSN